MSRKYILIDDEPVRCDDLLAWAEWFETADRQVALDIVPALNVIGGVTVSTIFLGLDHNWHVVGEPLLWETRIFGGAHDGQQWRASTRGGALSYHRAAVQMAQEGIAP